LACPIIARGRNRGTIHDLDSDGLPRGIRLDDVSTEVARRLSSV
jgi:hypothetical protein